MSLLDDVLSGKQPSKVVDRLLNEEQEEQSRVAEGPVEGLSAMDMVDSSANDLYASLQLLKTQLVNDWDRVVVNNALSSLKGIEDSIRKLR